MCGDGTTLLRIDREAGVLRGYVECEEHGTREVPISLGREGERPALGAPYAVPVLAAGPRT